jgi:hypothetical protein
MSSQDTRTPETILGKMSVSIWGDAKICKEEKNLKKKWFVQNGAEIQKEQNYQRPVLMIVVKRTSKKNVAFGPVVQVAVTPFEIGKQKDKIVKEAMSFLVLAKDGGFTSVIVDPNEYDMEMTSKYPNDMICQEVSQLQGNDIFIPMKWFPIFVGRCEEELLPRVQAEYTKVVGKDWVNPLRLMLKRHKSASTTLTSSTGRSLRSNLKSPIVNQESREKEPA